MGSAAEKRGRIIVFGFDLSLVHPMWGDFMEGDHVCGRPRARATTCAGDHVRGRSRVRATTCAGDHVRGRPRARATTRVAPTTFLCSMRARMMPGCLRRGDPCGRPRCGRPRCGRPRCGRPRCGRPRCGRPRCGRPRCGRPRMWSPLVATHVMLHVVN